MIGAVCYIKVVDKTSFGMILGVLPLTTQYTPKDIDRDSQRSANPAVQHRNQLCSYLQGLCTRLYAKLTAHTLCIYLNRLIGKPDFLRIKSLAFPI